MRGEPDLSRTNGQFHLGRARGCRREGTGPGDPERPGGRTEQLRPHDCERDDREEGVRGGIAMGLDEGGGGRSLTVQSSESVGLHNAADRRDDD